jgi:hypothetical protein
MWLPPSVIVATGSIDLVNSVEIADRKGRVRIVPLYPVLRFGRRKFIPIVVLEYYQLLRAEFLRQTVEGRFRVAAIVS